jgi:hypothetical protein
MKTAPIGLGAFRLSSWYFGPQLVHMRSHWVFIMEFVLFYFVVFLASMHLLQEGQMD